MHISRITRLCLLSDKMKLQVLQMGESEPSLLQSPNSQHNPACLLACLLAEPEPSCRLQAGPWEVPGYSKPGLAIVQRGLSVGAPTCVLFLLINV